MDILEVVFDEKDRLPDLKLSCGICNDDIVGYCNNSDYMIDHRDLLGEAVGDYFFFCKNTACVHNIGVFEASGETEHDHLAQNILTRCIRNTFLYDTINSLMCERENLKSKRFYTSHNNMHQLDDEYKYLQRIHSNKLKVGDVNGALETGKKLVEKNLEKIEYCNLLSKDETTRQKIKGIDNLLGLLYYHNELLSAE